MQDHVWIKNLYIPTKSLIINGTIISHCILMIKFCFCHTFILTKLAKEVSNSLITSAIGMVEGSVTDNSCSSIVTFLKISFVKWGMLPL